MSPELTAVVFGLACAALWGAGDFSGGISTKRTPVLVVLIVSQIVGFILMAGLVLLNHDQTPATPSILWAAAAGISGGIGVGALYRALAIGQMGIAAPIAAVFTALIPVLFSLATEGLPRPVQLAGFALALVGVWILSQQQESASQSDTGTIGTQRNRQGLGLAVIAGVSFGVLLVGLARAGSTGAIFWPLAAARASSILFMLVVATLRRVSWKIERSVLPIIVLAGMFDVLGNAAYVVASQMGRLDVAAVLSSLYPASTVILAALILKERISRTQLVAIGIVLVAIILITLPKST